MTATLQEDTTKTAFKLKVQHWAKKLDIQVTAIAIRPMKNKWASCSSIGRLNFDTTLLTLKSELQDYVIVHELLHIRVPNHGKLWKALMMGYLGDYTKYEAELTAIISNDRSYPSKIEL